ncbi:MAG TPA: hypothetical protein QF353_06705 [Gammaproteobacteria bacterium]|nr:hypothetical protein [Gammaproteobacteria bacterium]
MPAKKPRNSEQSREKINRKIMQHKPCEFKNTSANNPKSYLLVNPIPRT